MDTIVYFIEDKSPSRFCISLKQVLLFLFELMCHTISSLQSNFFKEMFHKRKMLNEEITFMAWQRSAIEKINDWSLCLSDNLLNKVLKGFIDETTVYWWLIAVGRVPALFYVYKAHNSTRPLCCFLFPASFTQSLYPDR